MAPEDEDVGLIERGVAESLIGIGEAGGLYLEILILRQFASERLAKELATIGLHLLGLLFVPDEDADRFGLGGEGEEGEKGEEKAHGGIRGQMTDD
jgi:hypothetical protein